MKRSIAAAAFIGLACNGALAQSSVALYGIVDVGLLRESRGIASATRMTGGIASGSRPGFKGTEDLGGGASALFLLEAGINVYTGASGQGNPVRPPGLCQHRQQAGRHRHVGVPVFTAVSDHVLADPFVSGTGVTRRT